MIRPPSYTPVFCPAAKRQNTKTKHGKIYDTMEINYDRRKNVRLTTGDKHFRLLCYYTSSCSGRTPVSSTSNISTNCSSPPGTPSLVRMARIKQDLHVAKESSKWYVKSYRTHKNENRTTIIERQPSRGNHTATRGRPDGTGGAGGVARTDERADGQTNPAIKQPHIKIRRTGILV